MKHLVRITSAVLLLLVGISAYAQTPNAKAPRPNVLLISIDDLNDWVGFLKGHPQTITPNIDRLAGQGVVFSRTYCAAPSCNPSRTATLTGIAPWESGVYRNGQKWRQVLPDAVTLPQLFKNNGYYCAGGGKIFHHYQNDVASWHEYFPSITNGFPPNPRAPKKDQPKFEKWDRYYGEFTWGPQADDIDDEKTGDYQSVQYVIEKLKSLKSDRPFFLNCGIYRPHVPWFVPRKYFEKFPLDKIKLPETRSDDLDDLPPKQKNRHLRDKYYNALDKNKLHGQAVQGYLASVNYMDAMVGLVLDALDKSPHKDNTIVVFWSDHGYHLSEKHWYRKFTLWDDSVHVPLIIRLPKSMSASSYANGQTCSRAVGLLDLYPTITALAGLKPPKEISGRSLVPLLQDPKKDWPHPVLTVRDWARNYSVRTEKWCYIKRPDGHELYDQQNDPHQFKNLASDPTHAATLARLQKHLPKNPKPAGMTK